MKILARKNILNTQAYVAGKPIEEVERQFGLRNIIKLASNENPLGPSPKAVAAIRQEVSKINRYPDSHGFYLKKKLSCTLAVAPDNIILGNGSDELVDIIIKTFVEEDENIITSDVTFLEYEIIARVNNRKVIKVPLKNFKYDLKTIGERVNKKTKIIFVANPNNPTGTYVNRDELKTLLRDLPGQVLLVLDEAYDTFIDVEDFPYGLSYLRNNKNILVLKTFSKAYGLAGLRIGYAVADAELVAYMEKARQPFNVNFLAQVAALASLDDKKFLSRTRKLILQEKHYLYRALKRLGIEFVPSVANFILMNVNPAPHPLSRPCVQGPDLWRGFTRCGVKRSGLGIFKEMLKSGVIVRDMQQYGLENFIRITIGTREENKKFIKVLTQILEKARR